VLNEAVEAAASVGDRRVELRAFIEREFCRSFTSPEGSALEDSTVAEQVIPEMEALDDNLGLAKAWWLKSEPDLNACRWGARTAALERALEHARRSGAAIEVAAITSLHAQGLHYGPTPVPEAIDRCERYLAESSGNRSLEASVTGVLGGLRAMQGDFDRARSLHAHARSIYEELGQRFRLVNVSSLLAAEIEEFAGQTGAAVAILRNAFETVREMGAMSTTATIAAFLADALCLDGRLEEADEAARFSEEHAPASDVVTQVLWRSARARAVRAVEPETAQALARHAAAAARQTDYPDLEGRALRSLAEVLGPGDEQSSLLAEARRIYERKGNVAAAARLPAPSPAPS
jgi:ATP/maltotriose-dependent transcriptional regulator MalT